MNPGSRITPRSGGCGVGAWVASDASLSAGERPKLALFANGHFLGVPIADLAGVGYGSDSGRCRACSCAS
jgi:hypothetical protein